MCVPVSMQSINPRTYRWGGGGVDAIPTPIRSLQHFENTSYSKRLKLSVPGNCVSVIVAIVIATASFMYVWQKINFFDITLSEDFFQLSSSNYRDPQIYTFHKLSGLILN